MSFKNETPKVGGALLDVETRLKDAGAVTSSAAAQVDGAAKVLNIGPGKLEGYINIDVSALDIASNDEVYQIIAQFSDSATFASGIKNGAILELAATEVAGGGADDAVIGRYKLPFTNEINEKGSL